jgi:hypothetical protein
MSQSIMVPRHIRTRVLVGAGAAVVACVAIGFASVFVNSAPSVSTRVENAVPVVSAPALSAQARDAWYLEPTTALSAPAISAQAHDKWYLEPKTAFGAPALSAQARDKWYLEPKTALSAPAGFQ